LIPTTLTGEECGFVTVRGYRAAKARPSSTMDLRDELLLEDLTHAQGANYSLYGVPMIQNAMRRGGWDVGRDQVARFIRKAGLRAAVLERRPVTTRPTEKTADLFPDLVKRRFAADALNLS